MNYFLLKIRIHVRLLASSPLWSAANDHKTSRPNRTATASNPRRRGPFPFRADKIYPVFTDASR
jgi:hypothetical protein